MYIVYKIYEKAATSACLTSFDEKCVNSNKMQILKCKSPEK